MSASNPNQSGGTTSLLRIARTECRAAVAFLALPVDENMFATATYPVLSEEDVVSVTALDELLHEIWDDAELAPGKVLIHSVQAGSRRLVRSKRTEVALVRLDNGPDGRPLGLLGVAGPSGGVFGNDIHGLGALGDRVSSYLRARQQVRHWVTHDPSADAARSAQPEIISSGPMETIDSSAPDQPVLPESLAEAISSDFEPQTESRPESEPERDERPAVVRLTERMAERREAAERELAAARAAAATPDDQASHEPAAGDEEQPRAGAPAKLTPVPEPAPAEGVADDASADLVPAAGAAAEPTPAAENASGDEPVVESEPATAAEPATDAEISTEAEPEAIGADTEPEPGVAGETTGEPEPAATEVAATPTPGLSTPEAVPESAPEPDPEPEVTVTPVSESAAAPAAGTTASAGTESPAEQPEPSTVEPEVVVSEMKTTTGQSGSAVADPLQDLLAGNDPVTGMPPLASLLGRIGRMLGAAQSTDAALAVIAIEIPGDHASEAGQRAAADALRAQLRFDDPVAHIGQSVFATALPFVTGITNGQNLERGLTDAVQAAVTGTNSETEIRAGHIVASLAGGDDADQLLRSAVEKLRAS